MMIECDRLFYVSAYSRFQLGEVQKLPPSVPPKHRGDERGVYLIQMQSAVSLLVVQLAFYKIVR
uniref:Uncharacterized protein n=1 Tax=Tolypothrix bouteillei VB521301 TaxID=1479485 RepID=A0A0C1R7L0_9CYAN